MSSLCSVRGQHILVTGGAGYIGSHTVLVLLQSGARVTVIDNLSNSSREAIERVNQLAKQKRSLVDQEDGVGADVHNDGDNGNGDVAAATFLQVDLLDPEALGAVFQHNKFDACIHFAGLKSVGASVLTPLSYYETNVCGTLHLLKLLDAHDCRRLVFSSSATVYGAGATSPLAETAPLGTTNPYGQSKLVVEEMLRDVARAPVESPERSWRIVILRYFNPIGAHESGRIGEDPIGIPNNLLPFVMQTAVGRRECVSVFGSDYPTVDGTGVRDYIHVMDLAEGHLAALQHGIFGAALAGASCDSFNLGSGVGASVLQVIAAAEKAVRNKIPHKVCGRRVGDLGSVFADPSKALAKLHWRTRRSMEQAVADSWRWQAQNPTGFAATKDQVNGK